MRKKEEPEEAHAEAEEPAVAEPEEHEVRS